jgi:hypothetical protein
MREVTVFAVIFGGPSLISTGFAVIPVVVVLVALVVVPPLDLVVPISMLVVLMVIILKIDAREHPRWAHQGRPQQK